MSTDTANHHYRHSQLDQNSLLVSSSKTKQQNSQDFKQFSKTYQMVTQNSKQNKGFKIRTYGKQLCDELDDKNRVSNAKPSGGTWDHRHMDQFMDNQRWASTSTTRGTTQEGKRRAISNNFNDSAETLNPNANKVFKNGVRQSFYFVSQPRNLDPRQSDYPVTGGKQDYTIENPLVNLSFTQHLQTQNDQDILRNSAQNFYNTRLVLSDHKKILEKTGQIDINNFMNGIITGKDRKKDLLEYKQQLNEYLELKKKRADITRTNRIINNRYYNGIMGVENINNDDTALIYQKISIDDGPEENMRSSLKKSIGNWVQEQQAEDMFNQTHTNMQIEFNNSYTRQLSPPKDMQNACVGNQIYPNWNSQKRDPSISFIDSYQRVFKAGNKPYPMARAQFLYDQEHQGRNYHIITNTDISLDEGALQRSHA